MTTQPNIAEAAAPGEPILLCWSGGKDSAMTLYTLQRAGRRVAALLTTVTETYDRISMHGVRRELLERQAAAIGLPLALVRIPPSCVNEIYESRMRAALDVQISRGIRTVAFGDIFLEDVRRYREQKLAGCALQPIFPLWQRDSEDLFSAFVALGFRSVIVCVDPRKLDPSYAGRELDAAFLRHLPPGVDPCGENGEFHSFVYDGPIFQQPVLIRRGEVVERDGFVFCDLL